MSWQSSTINPATTSPATDITKITNDLSVLKSVLTTGAVDSDFPAIKFGYDVTIDTTANALIQFKKAGASGYGLKDDSATRDLLFLASGSSEKARLCSATGALLIGSGTDDTTSKLQVTGITSIFNSAFNPANNGSQGALRLSGSFGGGVTLVDGSNFSGAYTTAGSLNFYTNNASANTPASKVGLVLTANLRTLVGTTTEAASGANAGVLQLAATSTSGLYLGNTANAAANVLDWYEEGTFTPTAKGSTTAGTGTYTTQAGKYTRIGNRVFFNLSIALTAHTGTGNFQIDGLPFAFSSSAPYPVFSVWFDTLAAGGSPGQVCVSPSNSGSTYFSLWAARTDGLGGANVAIDGTCTVWVTGQYSV